MDTFRYKGAHHLFLQVCFAGLAIQSVCTAIVYSNEVLGFVSYVYHLGIWQHDWGRRSLRVRAFASLSTVLIIIEVFLGVALISLTVPEATASYRKAGILEWIIVFLGTIYLWLFCGFLDRYILPPWTVYHRTIPLTIKSEQILTATSQACFTVPQYRKKMPRCLGGCGVR
ncbi:hypothetical protein BDV26DRAFT_184527 [Aspergillus bertholletiae]|uniref:Uncharacterized protein n=1 Tax=Aspergillus bertholletiae TaxID=1226010 RepID=A0A5N7BAD8_9EURO|nr:hypothetical protein BDV26DRAFT_184527 [Aspergillus bertholletiae]